MLQINEKQHN